MATMEDLTKTQIVLLTLLVSFITSIATGIITTSLLAQAPASVTQTINRVVEHTIETVTSSATSTGQTVHEVTVVKEDDAILAAINKTTQGVVSIDVQNADGSTKFYALGAIVSKDGAVVSDGQGLAINGSYTATLSNGTHVPLTVVSQSPDKILAVFTLVSSDKTKTFTPIPLAQSDPKLGQTIVAYEGGTDIGISVGRVQRLIGQTASSTARTIATDISARGETAGGPLVTLTGELVGIKSSSEDLTLVPGSYTALNLITTQLAARAGR